ncbi:MAG: response regulator [Desulfatitalea sp.]|nr:response regulator [Desulfatitalea sp.]NNJ99205.1 response regulator [Desulfatitalea sp.]
MIAKDAPLSLLIVDDEAGIRRMLSITLADMGYHVLSAPDGTEALRLFEAHAPAIVLADIKMPGTSGVELLKAVKGRNADTEVIMMTGHGDLDAAIECLKLDAADYIIKPLRDDALEISLKRARIRIAMRSQLACYTERLERRVAEKTEQLVAAERRAAISQTIAGLSHAIKNIAGGLTGGAYCVDRGIERLTSNNAENTLEITEGWRMVKANVARISRLSMDLIHYAKTSHCRCGLQNPNSPMEAVAEDMRPKLSAAGITLDMTLCAGLEPVFLDPELIHQALLNLALNAMEAFEDPPGPDRRIALKTARSRTWGVVYQVRDNACGMDKAVQEKLFNHFFTTKGSNGTGIGLMIVKNIVETHRGKVLFTSRPGKGTQMTVLLPRGE